MPNSPKTIDPQKDPGAAWRQFAISQLESSLNEAVCLEPARRDESVAKAQPDLVQAGTADSATEQLHAAERVAKFLSEHNKEARYSLDKMTTDLGGVFQALTLFPEYAAEAEAVAPPTDGLTSLPDRLIESINLIKQRSDEKRRQQALLIDELQNRIAVLEKLGAERGDKKDDQDDGLAFALDACTGLPGKQEAEAAIREAINMPEGQLNKFAVVFYVHRLNLINKKYGHVVGDSILLLSSQHVATRIIRQADALFRWSGPAFLGVLEREEPISVIKSEVNRLLSATLERYFESQDRSVFLPIRLKGHVFEVRGRTLAEINDDVETFILRSSEQS